MTVTADAPVAAQGPRHARRDRASGHGPGAVGTGAPAAGERVPTAVTGRYLPALDGLRAVAVGGVLAYHLGFGWAKGGYLGVDLFFVLSGFLITSLLLEEWVMTGGIRLPAFWARRARRLLPALFLVLVAIGLFVVLYGSFGPPGGTAQIDLSGLRGDALATLFYVANWHAIFAGESYFAHFSVPSPLEHTWSLAIEEQFYLVWPLVLVLLLKRSGGAFRRVGMVVTVVGALASSALMALLYHPGADPTRVYFGTDTRIFDMLAGATVAMMVAARPQPGPAARRVLHVVGPLAAVVLAVFWVTAGSGGVAVTEDSFGGLPSSFMFEGGFLVCAVLAALVISDARLLDRGPLGSLLGLAPLRWIGKISYGIYLWHWPIFVYLTQQRTGWAQPWLDLARVGLTLAVSAASFYLVEQPIRRRRLAGWPRFALAPVAAAVTAGVVVVATIPAVAAPTSVAPSVAAVRVGSKEKVPGAGDLSWEQPIHLLPGRVLSPSDPLRVMYIGDSVMFVAELGVGAALGATGEVANYDRSIDGFGLSIDHTWAQSLSSMVAQVHPDLVVGTWGWDNSCNLAPQAQQPPCALEEPVAYKQELERMVRLLLAPGDGVSGVIFTQYPLLGPALASSRAQQEAEDANRWAGQDAWQAIVHSLPAVFPGKVMFLPVGSSVLLDGKYFSSWLPPATDPHAPKGQWVRVRMIDDVHMCPAGVVRYADAVLADLATLFHLPTAAPGWWNGSWTSDPRYNTPPGSCPDDHPPS